MGTNAFTEAVVARLGQTPQQLEPAVSGAVNAPVMALPVQDDSHLVILKQLVGTDVFSEWSEDGRNPDRLAEQLRAIESPLLSLHTISNRGVVVWPHGLPETHKSDHWRCRFLGPRPIEHENVLELLRRINLTGLDFIKTEHLYTFDGEPGYSLGQGQ